MKNSITAKSILLSFLFAVIILIEALIIDYILGLLLENVVFKFLNWFNDLNIFFQIFIIVVGGFGLLMGILKLFYFLGVFMNFYLFKYIPENMFIAFFSVIIFIGNIILDLKVLWDSFPKFDFWLIVEFVFLAAFIYGFNTVLLIRRDDLEKSYN